MWTENELSKLQAALVRRNILDLTDDVDTRMFRYVRVALGLLEARDNPPIEVRITSSGGDSIAMLRIYDLLAAYPNTASGTAIGFCDSSAAIILQACDVRKIYEHSQLLVHNVTVTYQFFSDELEDQDCVRQHIAGANKINERMYRILTKRTGFDRERIAALCKENRKLDAEEALELKLVDEIIGR